MPIPGQEFLAQGEVVPQLDGAGWVTEEWAGMGSTRESPGNGMSDQEADHILDYRYRCKAYKSCLGEKTERAPEGSVLLLHRIQYNHWQDFIETSELSN